MYNVVKRKKSRECNNKFLFSPSMRLTLLRSKLRVAEHEDDFSINKN